MSNETKTNGGRIFIEDGMAQFAMPLTDEQNDLIREFWYKHGDTGYMMICQPRESLLGAYTVIGRMLSPNDASAMREKSFEIAKRRKGVKDAD